MAKLFKDKLLTIIITLSISLFIGCSKEEMQMNTYRFISYSCISDASDCSEIYNTFPINENFIIYDTQSNADAQMIEMFKDKIMNKNYETPSIEIINYETEIQTGPSIVIDYPWASDEDGSGFFE